MSYTYYASDILNKAKEGKFTFICILVMFFPARPCHSPPLSIFSVHSQNIEAAQEIVRLGVDMGVVMYLF
jgi:hypothetical protein